LILDTDAPAPVASSMGVLMVWPGQAPAPQRLVFLASETDPPACATDVLQTERAEREREELNALYVAMTRAQQRLVLSSVQPHREAPRSWWQRLAPLCTPLEVADLSPPTNALSVAPETVELACLPSWTAEVRGHPTQAPMVGMAQPSTLAVDSTESRVGQAMHRLLEWAVLDQRHCSDAQVRAVTSEFALDDHQAQQAAEAAQHILGGEGAWAWDATRVDWHGNEVSLAWQSQILRLDRLVHRSDTQEWWVLDYKSHAQPHTVPELVIQLRSYREAVQSAYPNDVVRCAFLTAAGSLKELT